MKKISILLSLIVLSLSACNVPVTTQPGNTVDITTSTAPVGISASLVPATETQVPPVTGIEVSATATTESLTPEGEVVTYGGISFLIPNGLASGATSSLTTEVELPFVNPGYGDMPQHVSFVLENYAAQGIDLQPQILVFRVSEYSQYAESSAKDMAALQNLQYVDGQPFPQDLPSSIPPAQVHAITFQNGKGIRYLTQVMQGFSTINNEDLFYNFHGITSDGQYYIQAILPTQAPFLAADSNPNSPLPPEGIAPNMDDFPGYVNAVMEKLNATDGFTFTPYLDHMDAMMESLLVTGY